MSALEIALLIIGILCFVGSFFFTEKLSSSDIELIQKLSEKEVKNFVNKELEDATIKMDQLFNEKADAAMEKIEVATDKDTNQKLMSIGEYSDTILETMNKSHDEIMFIYQMLNDKQENITNIVSEIQTQESNLRNIKASIEEKLKELDELQIALNEKENIAIESERLQYEEDMQSLKEAFIQKLDETKNNQPKTGISASNPNLEKDSKEKLRESIISMNKEGFSEVEIAKKCGVGIGEVKLILGLYDEV